MPWYESLGGGPHVRTNSQVYSDGIMVLLNGGTVCAVPLKDCMD